MEPTSQNIERLYRKYSVLEDDVIFTGTQSIYTASLLNSSSSVFSVEHYNPTRNYDSLERASDSESNFPLAKLLQESWWNVFDDKYFRHSWEWTLTLIIAYMTILIAGVIGNSMVILVVLQRHQMRTVTNIFIMNLAVADLFVIVFCVGPTLLANVLQRKLKTLPC